MKECILYELKTGEGILPDFCYMDQQEEWICKEYKKTSDKLKAEIIYLRYYYLGSQGRNMQDCEYWIQKGI